MEFLHALGKNPLMHALIGAWILIQILLPGPVGTNPMSRMATMAAICAENRFEITSYIRLQDRYDWTVDWSRTPDGRYFSNKAPGSALLATPIFCIVDRFFYGKGEPDVTTRTQKQYRARWAVTWIASLLLQILPMALLVLMIDGNLKTSGASARARRFMTLALLFGHTGAIYMNSWWGHGLSVVLGLASFMTLQSKKFATFGFMLGLALLNDYAMALMIPGFIALIWNEKPTLKNLGQIILGGILPGAVWILYHQTSFGSPFTLPNAFQNPLFVEHSSTAAIGGIFFPYPKPLIVLKLLFWTERGLLFTQPWILVVLALMLQKKYRALVLQPMTFFLASSFLLLFCMNASFNGWHGGNTVGPRYLSPILPFFAIWMIPVFDQLSERTKRLLEMGVIVSIILFIASYTITIEPPTPPLWTGFYRASHEKDWLTLSSRFLVQVILLIGALRIYQKREVTN